MPSFPVDSGTWAGKTRLFRADQIVVRIRTNPQVSALDLTARNADLFADVLATIPGSRLKGYVGPFGVIALPSQTTALDALAALAARTAVAAGVEFAEPDFLMVGTSAPAPLWPYDKFLQAPVDYYSWQWGMKDIGMAHAWAVQQGNDGVFIAVIDSGIASHLDLEGSRLWYGGDYLDEYEITGIFSTTEGDKVADLNGHGLAMTGIVGAKPQLVPPGTPDLSGCCGMNWASPIGICRSLDDSKNGTVSSVYGGVMQSLLWGKDEGMRVVANLSVILSESGGDSLTLESLCDVVKAEGALLVCGTGDVSIGAPASYANDPTYAENVVAVGYTQNLTGVEEPATGSPEGPTVVAPGRDLTVLDFWDSYAVDGGSSLATAHVTGFASLLWSHDSTLTPSAIVAAMRDTAYLPPSASAHWGDGRIQVDAGLDAVTPRAVLSLVIDESGSMSAAAGPSGVTRMDVVKKAIEILLTVLNGHDIVGMVAFSSHAERRLDPIELDPADLTASTSLVRSELAALAPSGTTSIGAGVLAGAAQLGTIADGDVFGQPRRAILLLTDGRENEPPYVNPPPGEEAIDVPGLGVSVFAIGAGSPDAVDVTALDVLAVESGGAALLTGDWADDTESTIAKFLIQHLVDVLDETVILDPAGTLGRGETKEFEFPVTDLEMRVDVIAFLPDGRDVELQVIAPDGTRITPSALPYGVAYDEGVGARIYRITVPCVSAKGASLGRGAWRARLVSSDRSATRYTVLVKARSRVRLDATVDVSGRPRPGAVGLVRARLIRAGLPRWASWSVREARVEWSGPDGTKRLPLKPEGKELVAEVEMPDSGTYRGRIVIEGVVRGSAFRREKLVSAAAWSPSRAVDEDGNVRGTRPRHEKQS